MKIKNFALGTVLPIVLVLSLLFVLATSTATDLWIANGNVTALYDEGIFTVN